MKIMSKEEPTMTINELMNNLDSEKHFLELDDDEKFATIYVNMMVLFSDQAKMITEIQKKNRSLEQDIEKLTRLYVET